MNLDRFHETLYAAMRKAKHKVGLSVEDEYLIAIKPIVDPMYEALEMLSDPESEMTSERWAFVIATLKEARGA